MKSLKTLKPGQPGTYKWVQKYGNKLLYVRYRYNEKNDTKLTTVEIIAEKTVVKKRKKYIPHNKIMNIKILPRESHIQSMIKSIGGTWNPIKRLWKLPYHNIKTLGLEHRIIYDKKRQ